jgi:hypothetical protein
MQSFGNGDRLDKRKVRSAEGSKEALIGILVRLPMYRRALASGAQRSIVEFSHSGARGERKGKQEDTDEHSFPLHHTNWTAC